MTFRPTIIQIKHSYEESYDIFLRNTGSAPLPKGSIEGKTLQKDGTVSAFREYVGVELSPGETTKLHTNLYEVQTVKDLVFTSLNGQKAPISGTITKGFFGYKFQPS